jgi:hypothetical protein
MILIPAKDFSLPRLFLRMKESPRPAAKKGTSNSAKTNVLMKPVMSKPTVLINLVAFYLLS